MKKISSIILLVAFCLTACAQDKTYVENVVKAGHGYAEPYSTEPGIRMREKGNLSRWTDQNRKAVWYLYQEAGTYIVDFKMRSSLKKNFDFEMKTSPCYDDLGYTPQDFRFSWSAPGNSQIETVKNLFTVKIPTTGYYRYELSAKSSMEDLTIDELIFNGIEGSANTSLKTNATDYLSTPSVHLSFSSTDSTSKKYDWIYEEILVPEGYDPLYTYWMSLGFFRGYMGIQTNSDTERRVLFSVWDAIDRDQNPNADKELLVSLVDKAEYTKANDFGNEGTGGQSYVGVNNPDTWKTGVPVKFLMNVRQAETTVYDDKKLYHSIISAWYDSGEGWKYIASWRMPTFNPNHYYFDGFYSFIENYGYTIGNLKRKGYYYNAFGYEIDSNKWIHFNKTRFSNTDGSVGQRVDYEQGVSLDEGHTDQFYMASGGYGKTLKTADTVPLLKNFPYLENLDLKPFIKRVDQALATEAGRK